MKFRVLLDKNVNLDNAKKLFIEAVEFFNIENLENKNKNLNQTKGLLILGGPTTLNGRLAGENTDTLLESLKQIIGEDNMGGILHVEMAIQGNFDYLVTNDKDILRKIKQINEKYPCLKIVSEEGK